MLIDSQPTSPTSPLGDKINVVELKRTESLNITGYLVLATPMFYLSDHVTLSPRISIVVNNFSVPFPEIMGTHFDIKIVSILHTISLPSIILF